MGSHKEEDMAPEETTSDNNGYNGEHFLQESQLLYTPDAYNTNKHYSYHFVVNDEIPVILPMITPFFPIDGKPMFRIQSYVPSHI
jgi:hypothetical protein